jgi:hypothetical protein
MHILIVLLPYGFMTLTSFVGKIRVKSKIFAMRKLK